jgi:6-bladed beta-propeller
MKPKLFEERGQPMMSPSRLHGVVAGFLLLALPALASAQSQPEWKGSIVKEGGVTVVTNPKEPISKTPILELKEELSIGGPEAQGQAVFTRIGEFVVDDAGNFYISAARGDDEIRVFDKTGRYLRTIGRHGQGPGEFDGIGSLSFVRATGELAITNIRLRCLTFYRTDGTYVRDLRFEDQRYTTARLDSKGRIYAQGGLFDIGAPYYEVRSAVLGPDGKVIRVLFRSPGQVKDRMGIWMPNMLWEIDPSDDLIVGYSKDYDLRVFDGRTHELSKRILKDYDLVPVREEEISRFKKPEYQAMEFDFAKQHAAYWNVFSSDTGHLFIETFERAGSGFFIHDVFDKEGRFLARVPLRSHGLKISGGKYYALEEDEDGYQYVKRYAVTWKVR